MNFDKIAQQIKVNTNNYPFLTFITKDDKTKNIFFSNNAAKMVAEGDTVTKELLSHLCIGKTNTAAGEERITLISNSERLVTEAAYHKAVEINIIKINLIKKWYPKEEDNYDDSYDSQTDWTHYDDNLDWDQQIIDFWNQF